MLKRSTHFPPRLADAPVGNENFPGVAIAALLLRGHDVVWIREDSPGIDDRTVLSRATAEERILITFDKDFGELVFRLGLNAPSGVFCFGFHPIRHGSYPDSRYCTRKSDGLDRTFLRY